MRQQNKTTGRTFKIVRKHQITADPTCCKYKIVITYVGFFGYGNDYYYFIKIQNIYTNKTRMISDNKLLSLKTISTPPPFKKILQM